MPPETTNATQQQTTTQTQGQQAGDASEAATPSYLPRDEFDAKLNAAITAHTKRLEKAFEERLAKLAPPAAPPPAALKPEGDGAPDPKLKLLTEKLEQFEKRAAEAEARARATELKAQHDRARTQVRELLESKGIKGVRATAVLAHLEASRALAFDDEGKASLTVKRSRASRAPAEELAFADLAAGVEDWSKTDEAREFLPPPAVPGARNVPARVGANGRPVPRFDKPATSADEAAARTVAQLEAAGVDVFGAVRRGTRG